MKKRRLLAITMLAVALTSVAKDYNIVIRHKDKSKNKTEMNKANAHLIAAVLTATSLAQAKDYHLVVKPSTGKASAFWGNTEVFVDGSAQHDTITMLKDGKNWRVRSKFLASNTVY